MKLGCLVFAAFVAIVALCFAYPMAEVGHRLRIAYLESAEEPLVDTANLLAEMVGQQMERDALDVDGLYLTAARVDARPVNARIYEMDKARVDLAVYITDADGRVVFDSRGRENQGADYSRWRDVRRTLDGGYGARVSNPAEPRALYVAAPIRVHGRIVGSLTVVKPTSAVTAFLDKTRLGVFGLGAAAGFVALVLMLLVSLWVNQQVTRLTSYADAVREGLRVPFPDLAPTELRRMGLAFERMRASLAGQTYVERYVRALTHEIKSPISAIRGAAEILESPTLDEQQRARFLRNVQHETQRVQDLVDRMLELSELEVRRALPKIERVALGPILRTIVEAQSSTMQPRGISVTLELPEPLEVEGDAFLLHMAFSNVIKNAVDWTRTDGRIRIAAATEGDFVRVVIEDEGPGIPDYAKERVFERFYSLERPDTGRKSTGLGLNFVSEIVALHHGRIELENRETGGLRATFTLSVLEVHSRAG